VKPLAYVPARAWKRQRGYPASPAAGIVNHIRVIQGRLLKHLDRLTGGGGDG